MSEIFDNDHLQKILEAAEKAPHGPWVFYKGNNDTDSRSSVQNSEGTVVDDGSAFREYDPEADDVTLYYISILDPDTVTAMVKRIQELEKMCNYFAEERACKVHGCQCGCDKDYYLNKAREAVKEQIPVDNHAK